jgi:hypothetical protein
MSGLLMAPVAPRASLAVTTKPNRGTDEPRQERQRPPVKLMRPKPLAFIIGALSIIDTGPMAGDRDDTRIKMASEGHLDPRCAIHGPRTDASKLPMTMVVKNIVNAPKPVVAIFLGDDSFVDDDANTVVSKPVSYPSKRAARRAGIKRWQTR